MGINCFDGELILDIFEAFNLLRRVISPLNILAVGDSNNLVSCRNEAKLMINVSILSIFSFCWFKKLYISYGENIFSKGLFYIFENNLLASEKRALAIIITLSVLFFIFLLGFVGKITKMFTNICLSYYIGQKLKDNPTSLFKAFLKGISRTFTIIFWAISSTLIGIIVSNLENKKSKGFISTFLSNLFGNLISIGWNIITYLIHSVSY